MLRSTLLYLANQQPVYRLVMRHGLLRELAWRFVAGETLADGLAVTRALNRQGLHVTLDHLGESVTSDAEARAAAAAYLDALDAIAAERLDANVSLKLTQMGMDVSEALCAENLRAIVARAAERGGIFVRVDMESSHYTDRTLDLHAALWREGFRNVGVVLQSYLYRTPRDLERVLELGARVRLCKGAYLEGPEVAFPRKADVDTAYLRLAEVLLERGHYPAFATHDQQLIAEIQRAARRGRISAERFEFQMLYGVRRDLQLRLAQQGYNVRVYVPYGGQWYPYLMRRMAERPANVTFLARSLLREALAGARAARPGGGSGRL